MSINRCPVIGITGYHSQENRNIQLKETYIQAVIEAGGLPLVLPNAPDDALIAQMVGMLDGLLLSGGGDVDPVRFGEERKPECGEPDWQRDEFELKITTLALKMGMPVFGICRGVQVLNVACGGTLVQDIPSQTGLETTAHRQAEPYDAPCHSIDLVKDGLLSRITGCARVQCNSMHHQAVQKAGGSLVVDAVSEDGIVEAVYDPLNEGVFGVQFHPEYLTKTQEYAPLLFSHFVGRAKAYRDQK